MAKCVRTFIRSPNKASLNAWRQHIHARWDHTKTLLFTLLRQAPNVMALPLSASRTWLRSLRTPRGWQALARSLLPLVVYAAAFVLAQYVGARLAIAITPKVGVATPLYLQGAVLVSALLVAPPRRWGLYLLITLLVLPIDLWLLRYPRATAEAIIPIIYAVLVSIAILTASLLRRWVAFPLRFATLGEVSWFVLCIAVSVIPGTLFITVERSAAFSWNFWFSLESGFLGYLLGIVVFTPAIVLWLTDGPRGLGIATRRRYGELALLVLVTIMVSLLVFGMRLPDEDVAHALIYTLVPVLIWAAVRFGPLALATALALSTASAVLGAVNDRGPFVDIAATDNVLTLQLFLLCVAVPLFFLTALVQERVASRALAQHQTAYLQATFEAMADGVAVYDARGTLMQENAALRRLLGLDAAPPNYATLSLAERMARLVERDTHGRALAPDEAPVARALHGEVLTGAETQEVQSQTFDGSQVELSISAAPLRDAQGHVTGAVEVLRDQTGKRQLERERAEQAAQLGHIFESIADGVAVYDASGHLVRTNPAANRLLGLDAAPANYAQLSPDDRAVLFEARDDQGRPLALEEWPLIRVLSGQIPPEGAGRAVRLRVLDGRELELYANAAPLRDADGHLLGAVSVLHDLSEQRRLEEARIREQTLREVNARLDTFATIAAHDLRAPLGVSRMVLPRAQQLLRRAMETAGQSDPDKMVRAVSQAAQAIDMTEQSLSRLWRLAQQLLDVARAREGTLVLQRQPVDLVELVRTCCDDQRLLNRGRAIDLRLPEGAESGAQRVIVDADPDRLSQVLTNFLTNAVRYAPEDQPIEVSMRVVERLPEAGGGRAARVAVRDHGPGIAPEDQATIWGRFQRASSPSEAKGGLGLGLYIAHILVELHGGKVGVESVVGEGSTFWFTLPLMTEPAAVNPDL